jgi:hypothetical protein
MNDHSDLARRTGRKLALELGIELPLSIERELSADSELAPAHQYSGITELASLVVSIAALAWTVYRDLRAETPKPPRHLVEKRLRLRLGDRTPDRLSAERERIIEVVIEELDGRGDPL